ncbi:hypothetical protein OGH69_13240 [Flavobacterium sp. MFBS3-15]|uniref:hypothetical protein n=1 Tax=Flavobacterium sp. MFBS3-15 TaxID=2989816 RepID=UPI002236BD37|nr:hypothetical protein [Flavobacterium sp. MFBS3-15]MCW4469938.1 hypothetical protein [Flavobacterium sp. MFBS3-15]
MMKGLLTCLLLLCILASCKKETLEPKATITPAEADINKGIALAKSNKPFNDTLAKFRKELGVDFMLCYIITKDKHRRLGFQILQSDMDHAGPMNLERRFRIKTLQGIDIFFCSSESDTVEYKPVIDKKTRELIDKGYLTDTGRVTLHESKSVSLVYCRNNDNIFTILPSEFLYKKEMEAHSNDKYYHEEDYYPQCK